MIRKVRLIVGFILLSLCLLAGCASNYDQGQTALDIIEEGSNQFADGKIEQDFEPAVDSGELLDEMIEKYAGSWKTPTVKPISDEELDDVKKKTDPQPDVSTSSVGSEEALCALFRAAYCNTDELVEFEMDPGFVPDGQMLEDIYIELRRELPGEVFCVTGWGYTMSGSTCSIVIQYDFPKAEIVRMKEETQKAVQQAASELRLAGNDAYTLVCAVNDYLCDTVEYPTSQPYSPQSHSAYGALLEGSAVCDGYSSAAMLLLRELGVNCDLVVGDTYGGGHAWNLVKVDGNWYQLDVTWNDSYGNAIDGGRTEFLLVTDTKMKESRVWDESKYPPSAPNPYPIH